jgi:hypothetical protein
MVLEASEYYGDFDFGSEIVALKTSVDLNDGLRYKHWMMGPHDGPTSLFCDNITTVEVNTMVPEYTMKQNHNAIV